MIGEEHQRRAHRQPEVGSHRSRLHLMVHYRVPTQIRRSVTPNHLHTETDIYNIIVYFTGIFMLAKRLTPRPLQCDQRSYNKKVCRYIGDGLPRKKNGIGTSIGAVSFALRVS